MFFVASKIFWLIAQPLSLVLILIVLALVALLTRHGRSAVFALVLAFGVIGLCGYTSLGAMLIAPLENRFALPRPPATVSAIVMLGGATLARPSTARRTVSLNDAGERLTSTLWLAEHYPDARIVLSGGGGLLSGETESEAETAKRFFVEMGIDPERLVLESASRNTIENAAFTQGLVGSGDGEVVLVTSAFHMPRSVGLFRQEGIAVLPWPTDYRSSGTEGFGIDIANPLLNLETTTTAMREWIGLVVYRMTGQIDELFPAP